MVNAGRAAQHYMQTQVRSASPLELVVMLYDGALRHTAAAIDAMGRGDIRARRDAITKSLAIISELQSTLSLDKGGAIAEELDRLYSWMTDSLVQATIKQEVQPIHDVRKILTVLRESWQQIAVARPESAA